MRNCFLISITILLLISFFSCSSLKFSKSKGDIPNWFLEVPQDSNYIYAANTATSRDLQLAIDKAAVGARAEIARIVELKLENLQKNMVEEVSASDSSEILQQFESTTKTVVSIVLSGTRIEKQTMDKNDGVYRAYVLVSYPIGEMNKSFVEKFKQSENLYTRFRASEAFKELEKEIEEYEKLKKK